MTVKISCLLLVAVAVTTVNAGVVFRGSTGAKTHTESAISVAGEFGKRSGDAKEKVAKSKITSYVDLGGVVVGGAYVGKVNGKNITGVGVDGQLSGNFKAEGKGEAGGIYKDGRLDPYAQIKGKVDKDINVSGGGFFGEVDKTIADDTIKRGSVNDLRNWR